MVAEEDDYKSVLKGMYLEVELGRWKSCFGKIKKSLQEHRNLGNSHMFGKYNKKINSERDLSESNKCCLTTENFLKRCIT